MQQGRMWNPLCTMYPVPGRFVGVILFPLCARVSRVCPGSHRCLFTGSKTPGGAGTLTRLFTETRGTGKKTPGEPGHRFTAVIKNAFSARRPH